jgi:hypothetical protein
MTVIDDLLPYVRLELGDISTPYRYLDSWIQSSLRAATIALHRFLYNKYLIDSDTDDIIRNTDYPLWYYSESAYGVIEPQDQRLFILMASIILAKGDLENHAWNIGSWKDYEISYSNIAAGRTKDTVLGRLYDELYYLVTPPTKKLASTRKGSLPGFIGNTYERKTKY